MFEIKVQVPRRAMRNLASLSVLAALTAILAGCGSGRDTPVAGPVQTTTLGRMTGSVHGGQQPVANAHIYVYAVGAGGNGTGSTSLLLPGAGTTPDANGLYYALADAGGNFSITGQYVCTAGTQIYLYASGGNAGAGNNPAIGLMAGLGQCPAAGTLALQVPFVIVNEVSTVVLAYSLAGFAVDATHIYSSGSSLGRTGLANAMANAVNIYPPASGQTPAQTANGAGTTPVSQIDMLANILAACVNTGTQAGSANACSTLFADATSDSTVNGVKPVETATAAINIAHYPFSNVGDLFTLPTASAPFQPTQASAPADFTVAVSYAGAGGGFVFDALAVDAAGSVWTRGSSYSTIATALIKYGPTGSVQVSKQVAGDISTGASADSSGRIDIDSGGNLWSPGDPGVFEFSTQGDMISPGGGYYCPGMDLLNSTVFGLNGIAYVGDQGVNNSSGENQSYIWELNASTGQCLGALTHLPGVFAGFLAVGSEGNIYTAGTAGADGRESVIYNFEQGTASETYFDGYGQFLRFDSVGDLWASAGTLIKYTASGQLLSPADGYTGGGLTPPAGGSLLTESRNEPLIDGAGNVWVARARFGPPDSNGISYYQGSLIIGLRNDGLAITSSTGLLATGAGSTAEGLALDGSGNLWELLNTGGLVQYLGLTTPVATPILYNNAGARP